VQTFNIFFSQVEMKRRWFVDKYYRIEQYIAICGREVFTELGLIFFGSRVYPGRSTRVLPPFCSRVPFSITITNTSTLLRRRRKLL
jgi:hypothetical protein